MGRVSKLLCSLLLSGVAGPSVLAQSQPASPAPVVPIPVPGQTPPASPAPAPLQFPPAGNTQPGSQTPTPPTTPNNDTLLANASARGTEAEMTAFPTVFGDLLGGGGIAGPLPVLRTATGQIVGPPVIVVGPGGQMTRIGGPPGPTGLVTPVDDLLSARAGEILPPPNGGAPPPGTPLSAASLLPPPGTTFDASLAQFVTRVPTFTRGAFKITENDTPRPTSRAYITYNFYDQVFKSFGGPNTPRTMLHQEIFGLEYAGPNRKFSVGLRLPYNQLTSPGFYSDTSLGDLTVIGKAVLFEDRESGTLLSGGLALTVPTGQLPFANTITGQNIRGTLIQPWLGHIVTWGDWYTQGFNALIVPTDSDDATFYSCDLSTGYFLIRNPGATVSAVIPTFEFHLNVPLNHNGPQNEPVGFVPMVTLLGGGQIFLRDRVAIGMAAGAPISGPRPFSLQTTFSLNTWF